MSLILNIGWKLLAATEMSAWLILRPGQTFTSKVPARVRELATGTDGRRCILTAQVMLRQHATIYMPPMQTCKQTFICNQGKYAYGH